MHNLIKLVTFLICIWTAYAANAEQPRVESDDINRENQIKAAMLYKFIWFVSWKDQYFKDSDSPINLCLAEPDPFGIFFERLIDGRFNGKQNRQITITRINGESDSEKLKECHILYISKMADISVQPRPGLLIITDDQSSQKKLAHINFVTENEHVRFEINRHNLNNSQIKISSSLLKLAQKVSD